MKKLLSALFCLTLVLGITLGLASCGKVEFKVDFVVDGEIYATVNTSGKETIKIPNDPIKEGHVFDGWYWDKDVWNKPFTANSLLDAPLSENMSVYAKWTSSESVQGVEAEFDGFTKISDTEYSITVSNSAEAFSLGTKVTINSKSSWTLTSDIYGNTTISSKVAPLEIGDNVYYALVTAENGQSEMYKLNIRRRPMYMVTFDTDGGTTAEAVTIEEDSLVAAPDTYKKGYTLSGWSYDFTTPITKNETISAIWLANEYVITYDANGGTVAHEETGVVYDVNYTLEVPTRTGYSFDSWYLGNDLFENGIWKGDSDITVVAKWSLITYEIEYNLDGGTLAIANPETYNFVSENITLINPEKTGYTFLGWKGTDVNEPTLALEIASGSIGNRSYVANWAANTYTVTFDTNGGNESYEDATATYDANITLPTPTKTGYSFAGWYEDTTHYTSGTWKTTKNVNLVAKWNAVSYDIGYTLNGGVVDGTNPTTYTIESEFTLINPTRTGYTFLGWTYGDVSEPVLNVSINDSIGALSFTANWKADSFKIYLDAMGGTVDKTEIPIDYDAEIVLPAPEYVGHTFTGWSDGTNFVTGGKYNLTTNMNLVAVWDLALYDIEYDLDGGTVDGKNPTAYTIESEFTLINPTKIGYTFLGWTYEGVTEPTLNVTISGRTENLRFVANFKANTNTPYKVEYYFENSNKNGYDILNSETENLAGTTDTTASVNPKTFDHFKFNSSKSTTTGNIDGEGTLVLKVYYDRNSYTVTTSAENTKGGSVTSGATKVYGNEITVTATVKAGYTWLGWYEGNALVGGDLAYTFMPTRNISLVAKWSANEDTFYTVEYYHQNIDNNDYSLIHSDILTGTTDTLATATINNYPHFTYYAAIGNASGNIDGEGDAVLKIYYTRSSYTVTTRAMNAKAGSVTSGSTYRYGKTITVTATTNPGYTFIGWYAGNTLVCETESYKFTVENAITLTAKWSANDDTKYTVEYYLENKNQTGYTKVDTTVLEGTTDTTANAVISEYEHFTFTNANSVISGNIAGNGKLVLKVYYTRDVYTINSAVENEKAGTVTSGGKYAYEKSVSLVASSKPGYTFLGWYEGDNKVCDTLTFTFNAEKNVTYTAKWSADEDTPYTVNFYKDNMTKAGYNSVFFNSITLLGTTDTLATFVADELDGYLFNAEKSVLTGNINGDGTLVLNVYYTLDLYYREEQYIYFGEYPQSLKADYVTITTTVDNRGYYLGSDGYYYAKIVAGPRYDKYYQFSSGEYIVEGNIYYFKVEPIRWRILSEKDGNAFILCDSVIDSRRFDDSKYNNNYETSEIRSWLTQEFFNTTFTSLQQQIVQIVNQNKVSLISASDLRKYFPNNSDRDNWMATDFSKAIGLELSSGTNYAYASWTSSPGASGASCELVLMLYSNGNIYDGSGKPTTECIGVIPSMWIAVNTCSISTATENPKAGFVSDGGNYEIGSEVKLVASSKPGYTFIGWYEGVTKVCDTLTFTFNAEKNVTYTAKWSADEDTPYIVKHYKQTDDRTGYELVDTQYLFGATDTTAQVISKTFDGLNVNNGISKLSGNISGDGSLILEVYYWRGYYRDGEYIYFGEYPQTIKSDGVQITNTKDERGYYMGSDGFYYAKIVSTQYNLGYKFSNDETVTAGETYYFKVEPIRWRVLSENGESAFILCDSIIDDHSYDEDKNNNYKDSDVRQWLNNEFYNKAFGEIQKGLIQVTTVDNSAASTESSNNSYACENTEDKVFLLSYREAIKSDYDLASKTNRKMQTTDYARAIGTWISTAESSYGYGDWWLRSPDKNYKNSVMVVYNTGTVDDNGYSPISDGEGIVPAMWIKL